MSLKDTLTAAIKGSAEEKPDAEDALRRYEEAREVTIKLETKQTELRRDLEQLETKEGDAALTKELTGDTKAYDALQAKITKVKEALATNLKAIRAAGQKRDQAADDLHKAKAGDIIKQGKRVNADRTRAAKQIADGIALLNEGWQLFHKASEKQATFGGPALTANGGYGGCLVTRQDIYDAVTQELSRVSSPPPLVASATPGLPGSRIVSLGNPKDLPPLVEEVTKANDYIIRKLEKRPSEIVQAAPQPAQQKPIAAVEQPAQPANGPTLSADMVMATIGRRQLEV